jgi:hypothetical protein
MCWITLTLSREDPLLPSGKQHHASVIDLRSSMQEIQPETIAMAQTNTSNTSLLKIVGFGLLASRSATALPDAASTTFAPQGQSRRVQLAHQVVSLSTAFLEAQRAGHKPADGDIVCPQVWQWKKPAFINTCKAYRQSIAASAADDGNLSEFSGYFEAGSTPFVLLFLPDYLATSFLSVTVSYTTSSWPACLHLLCTPPVQSSGTKEPCSLLNLVSNGQNSNCLADSVVATGPTAYMAAQMAIGALNFADVLNGPPAALAAEDSGSCLPPAFHAEPVMGHFNRQLRYGTAAHVGLSDLVQAFLSGGEL